jgi:hypothetical protein
LAGGSHVEADAVIVGVGITPATQLATDASLEADNGIKVDAAALLRPGHLCRRRGRQACVIAFWPADGRVLAGMNVNVWDVTDSIQALVRSGKPVDTATLADPRVPLELLLDG